MSRLLSLTEAKEAILDGELVGVPSETVYGLAANALNEKAVTNIFRIKGRPQFNPIICHFHDLDSLEKYVSIEPIHQRLSNFWPGPMTLLLKNKGSIPDIVSAGLPHLACRIPKHKLFQELLVSCKKPLAAPSANISTRPSPTTAAMVLADLGNKIAGVIDGGSTEIGLESTVIYNNGKDEILKILRPGGLTYETLQKAGFRLSLDKPEQKKASQLVKAEKQKNKHGTPPKIIAPGSLSKHYAPSLPLVLLAKEILPCDTIFYKSISLAYFKKYQQDLANRYWEQSYYIGFGKEYLETNTENHLEQQKPLRFKSYFNLSKTANLKEAAHNLFQIIYKIEQIDKLEQSKDPKQKRLIIIHLVPEKGLGRAINDRIRRAASIELT